MSIEKLRLRLTSDENDLEKEDYIKMRVCGGTAAKGCRIIILVNLTSSHDICHGCHYVCVCVHP